MTSGHRLFLVLFFFILAISGALPTTEQWESTIESTTDDPMAINEIEELISTPESEESIDDGASTPEAIDELPNTSETLLTTDYTTTPIPWEVTTYLTAEDMLMTAVKSKKEMSKEVISSTTESTLTSELSSTSGKLNSVTPPSIDSKDFLSEIEKTTQGNHQEVTNVKEKKSNPLEGTESTDPPPTLPQCEDSIPLFDYEDYENPDLSSNVESAGVNSKNRAADGWSDPNIIATTETSLTVAWKAPASDITVLYYTIEWDRGKPDEKLACQSSNQTFNHTITGLKRCTTYNVRVTAYTEDGEEPQQRLVIESTGLIVSEEKDSLNLKAQDKGTDWVKIGWNLPENGCVTGYVVSYCDSKNCTSVNTNSNETSFNVTELVPCTQYNFTLSVHGKKGEYGSTHVVNETNFLEPGQPSPAWTEAGKRTLKIFWTLPVGSSCVNYYRVKLFLDGDRKHTRNCSGNETIIDSLLSCRVYEISITPVHDRGESAPETILSNRTFPAVVRPPEVTYPFPNMTIHYSNRITIRWRVFMNEDSNCEETKLIARCNHTQVLGHGYDGLNGTGEITIEKGATEIIRSIPIENLSPFTMYHCYASAKNSQGISGESNEVPARTEEEPPGPPENLAATDRTDTQFVLNWKPPVYLPGNLTEFEMKLIWYPNVTGPWWCEEQKETSDNISEIKGNVFALEYTTAIPFSTYKIKVRAKTNAGWGNSSDAVWVQTKPGAPGPVSFLNYSMSPHINDPEILDFMLSWGKPCSIHSERIEHYNIDVKGERPNFETHEFTEIVQTDKSECLDDTCRKRLNLRDEYAYTIHVAGKAKDYVALGEKNYVTAMFPAGIPPLPDKNYTDQISIDPYKARRTTTTATILLPVFPDTNGNIRCYAIIVAKSGRNNMTHSRINSINDWPDIPSWSESMSVDFEIPYQAVRFCEHSNPSYIVDYGNLKAVKYVLGDDTETCPELSSNRDQRSFCNGPLKPDTWYDVRMRAFTNGGYRDSTIFTVKTNAEMRVAVVIGTILGILFLGILTTLMLLVRKCSVQAVLRRFLHSDMPGSPVPAPFTRRKFITHCQQLADNPGKLSNEFQLLQTLSVDLQMPTNAACLQANRKKNRYTDILPYDFSRVKLEPIDTDPNSDYINASFIKGFNGEEEYIACQGPKEETTYDFWRMIDQYDVKLIVMLTQLVEKNKEKCHQYFPIMKETFTYENMSIRCTTEFDYRTYTQRTLVLQKENEKRTITHLHFKDWPDHDVPEDFDPMINFCQIIRRYITANPGLAVVHCSAGIGRTGTLIAIDILLQHIKENRKLDVFGTVYRLRHHRINMVQRESQYAYIYNCIRQVLKNPYFSKTYKPPSMDPITDVNGKKKEPAITNLVSSLETLRKSSMSTSVESAEQIFHSSSSTSSSPKSRNCLMLGIKYSKSTSAICTKPFSDQIVRYNTLDYPIHDIDKEGQSSTSSLNDSEESSTSFYENHQPPNRSKSSIFVSEDPTVTEKLLDTSL